jgi:hypothetical protein
MENGNPMLSVSSALMRAVDKQDAQLITAIIPHCSHHQVNSALQLCLAHRENMEALSVILRAHPSQQTIDDAFLDCAWAGVFPKTLHVLGLHISSALSNELYRILNAAKKNGNKSFYFPSFLEEDRHKEIFSRLLPQRLAQKKKSLLQNHTWINELFEAEVACDHRMIIADLLTLPVGYPRPSTSTIANAFVFAVSRGNFSLARMMIQYEEAPMNQPRDLFLNQYGIDFAFQELLEMQDLQGVAFVLSQVPLRPDQALIESAYLRFCNDIYLTNLVNERLQEANGRLRGAPRRNWTHYWREYFDRFRQLLSISVSSELTEREKRRRERQNVLRQINRPAITEIHSFSSATVSTSANADSNLPIPPSNDFESGNDVGQPIPPRAVNLERKGLLDAVNDFISKKLGLLSLPSHSNYELDLENSHRVSEPTSRGTLPSIADVEADIIARIERLFPSAREREDAIQKLTQGIDNRSQNTLIRVWYFLHQNCPEKIDTWLNGFLGESVMMHSCNPGVAERVVTGLRGIEDPELDAIFAQAEGPFLARMFLNNAFNFALASTSTYSTTINREIELQSKRAKALAEYLVFQRGINLASSMEDIKLGIQSFAEAGVEGCNARLTAFQSTIDVVVDLAVDMYDECVKPFVTETLMHCRLPSGESASTAL